MKLHEVKAPSGARKRQRRVGRGTGSGTGKTAGKGTKGQLARSGPGLPAWFEGGQTPLHMRLPKLRGFKPPRQTKYVALNVGRLKAYAEEGRVTPDLLRARGLRVDQPVKILGDGALAEALEIHAHAFSATARRAIEGAGGSAVVLPSPGRAGRGAAAMRSSTPAGRGASPRVKAD